jgi:hypothetical protein
MSIDQTLSYILTNLANSWNNNRDRTVIVWLPIWRDVDEVLLEKTIDYAVSLGLFQVIDLETTESHEITQKKLQTIEDTKITILNKGPFELKFMDLEDIVFLISRYVNAQSLREDSFAFPNTLPGFQLSLIPDKRKINGYALKVERGTESEGLYPVRSNNLINYDYPLDILKIISESIIEITPGISSYKIYDLEGKVINFLRVSKGDMVILMDVTGKNAILGYSGPIKPDEEYLSLWSETVFVNGHLGNLNFDQSN